MMLLGIQAIGILLAAEAPLLPARPVHPMVTLQLPDLSDPVVRQAAPRYQGQQKSMLNSKRPASADDQSARGIEATAEHGRLTETLRIKPWLLGMPTPTEVDLSRPASGFGVPRQFAHLALEIEGRESLLWVIDVTQQGSLRHVSAIITNSNAGWALFTVENERIYGTIKTDSNSYRVLPLSTQDQGVYRLQDRVKGKSGVDLPVSLSHLGESGELTQRKHLQALKIAEMQFDVVSHSADGSRLAVQGGRRLGRFDTANATEHTVVNLLSRLGELTFAPRLSFQITERSKYHVRFRQVINGIHIEQNNEITTSSDGHVAELRILVKDPSRVSSRAAIPVSEGMRLAARKYSQSIENPHAEVEFIREARLYYKGVPGSRELQLFYEFAVGAPERPESLVTVNAMTSQVKVRPRVLQ